MNSLHFVHASERHGKFRRQLRFRLRIVESAKANVNDFLPDMKNISKPCAWEPYGFSDVLGWRNENCGEFRCIRFKPE